MARTPSGAAHVEAMRALLRAAKTADELRQVQAVLLPLELGLSLQQTALVIGRSVTVTCKLRTRLLAIHTGQQSAPRSKRALRNHATTSLKREAHILDEVLGRRSPDEAPALPVAQFKPLVEARLGKTLALSTLYRMLSRHGWHKTGSPARWVKVEPP